MPQSQSQTTAEAYTTLHEWLRQVSDHTARKYEVYRRLFGRGRVSMNHTGDQKVWPIKFTLPETRGYSGGQVSFPESDKHRQFSLAPQAVYCSDGMDMLTQYRNRGDAALVKRKDEIAGDIRESLQRTMNEAIYYDYADHPLFPAGVESFLTETTPAVGDRVALPNDDYGGFATDLQTLGGTWSDTLTVQPNTSLGYDWPLGKGTTPSDTKFDATSPFLFNVTSTAWSAGTNNVEDNLEEVISTGARWMGLTRGQMGVPDICVLAPDYYGIYENIQRAKSTINVPHAPGQDVGFRGFNQGGVLVMEEYGVPASTGYLLNTKTAELDCWTPQLFVPFFNQFELRSLSTLWLALFYGQFGWQPHNTGKIYPYAAS